MKTHSPAVFCLLTMMVLASRVQQSDIIPYRYPLKSPVNAPDALKKYREMRQRIIGIPTSAGTNQTNLSAKNEPFDCPNLEGNIRRCIEDRPLRYYVDEYLPHVTNSPALVPSSAASSTIEGGAAVSGWVPAEQVVEGQAVLKKLEDMETKKILEDCNDETGDCKTVVEAIPIAKGERVLAVCDVTRVGDELGAVKNCVAVAIVTPDVSYIRAVVGYKLRQAPSPKPDEWQATEEYRLEKRSNAVPMPSLASVLSAVQSALDSKFLRLKTELLPKDNPVRAVGVAGLRTNSTMIFLRERVSFRVDVEQEEGGDFSIKVAYNLQVNGQAHDRPEDYRPPNVVELGSIEVDLHQGMTRPLLKLCELGGFKDLKTVVCRSRPRPPSRAQATSQ